MLALRSLTAAFFLFTLAGTKADAQDGFPNLEPIEGGEPIPDTEVLGWEGDLAAKMVEGAHRFLDQKIDASPALREERWRDFTPDGLAQKRAQFRLMIGLRDTPAKGPRFAYLRTFPGPPKDDSPRHAVRWPAFADVTGAGHLFIPSGEPTADLILLVSPGSNENSSLISRLLADNIRVLIPVTIPRDHSTRGIPTREWLYRPAFEFGRHIIGYEVQKILSAAHALRASQEKPRPVAIAGSEGDHGMLALFAAAAAEPNTFRTVLTGGFFRPLEDSWRGPADHNLFGLHNDFGAAEIAALTSPQKLIVHRCPIPEITVPAGGKAKPTVPGNPPSKESIQAECDRAGELLKLGPPAFFDSDSPYASEPWNALTKSLGHTSPDADPDIPPKSKLTGAFPPGLVDAQIHELDRHTQSLITSSRKIRAEFMADLDFESPEAFAESQKPYRRIFAEDVIGEFKDELLPPNPRSRAYQKGTFTTSYEVVLDVFPGVFAYGILTVPDEIPPGEKLPVVVCQHGLEGRPQSVVGELQHKAYKAFATHLAERGFITFAPQNLYTGRDRFRLLQFKANPLGKTLFSLMVPQHQQIVDWLGTLESVDPERIAFYGLSYGGKSAMRIPPLVPNYCLSICSADFNEWIWKNASTDSNYSYADKGEYEIFEWNLGNTFNYAEMAALIAPRPFMVERGHFDGVAPDEMVAHEFAKVRHLYQARLGIGERAEIEWFVGPHTINGKGTYKFLERHLKPQANAGLPLEIDGVKFGIPIPGRPGMMRSPHDPDSGLIDARGLAPGTRIRCPFTGEAIAVPDFLSGDSPPKAPKLLPPDPFGCR